MKQKKPITEIIKGLEDVFAITRPSIEEERLIAYSGESKRLLGARAFLIAEHIAEAYNEGTILDWSNHEQEKWFGWLDMESPNSGFYPSDDFWSNDSDSSFSSRLHFKEEGLFWDAVTKFPKIYKQLMVKY